MRCLDQLSDGRLVLGLGSGYQRYEFHKFGLELDESRDHFLESLDVIEQFFRNDSVAYEGRYLKVPETYCSVRPLQSMPEVFVAGLLRDEETQQRMARSGYTSLNSAGGHAGAGRGREPGDSWRPLTARRAMDPELMPFAIQQYIHVTDSPRGGARCGGSHAFRPADRSRDARRLRRARWRLASRAAEGG